MNKHELTALAERVETAEGPSRELDALVWCALNGKRYSDHYEAYAFHSSENPLTQVEYTEPPKRTKLVTGRHLAHALPVTASIDAALTLGSEDDMADALREAFSFVQATGWPAGDFKGALARATVAAALRSQAVGGAMQTNPTPDALVERLRIEASDSCNGLCPVPSGLLRKSAATLAAMQERIERLESALEMFVGHMRADTFHGDVPDECYEAAVAALVSDEAVAWSEQQAALGRGE